jgi:hypothetical protein
MFPTAALINWMPLLPNLLCKFGDKTKKSKIHLLNKIIHIFLFEVGYCQIKAKNRTE